MASQQGQIDELLELVKMYPQLPVIPVVIKRGSNSGHKYTIGRWGTASVDSYFVSEDCGKIYWYSSHKDIQELINSTIDHLLKVSDESSGSLYSKARETVENLDWKASIKVFVEGDGQKEKKTC